MVWLCSNGRNPTQNANSHLINIQFIRKLKLVPKLRNILYTPAHDEHLYSGLTRTLAVHSNKQTNEEEAAQTKFHNTQMHLSFSHRTANELEFQCWSFCFHSSLLAHYFETEHNWKKKKKTIEWLNICINTIVIVIVNIGNTFISTFVMPPFCPKMYVYQ